MLPAEHQVSDSNRNTIITGTTEVEAMTRASYPVRTRMFREYEEVLDTILTRIRTLQTTSMQRWLMKKAMSGYRWMTAETENMKDYSL